MFDSSAAEAAAASWSRSLRESFLGLLGTTDSVRLSLSWLLVVVGCIGKIGKGFCAASAPLVLMVLVVLIELDSN